MANPAPTINQINAFNATQGTTIDFNIIGGTELVRSNRIYIYDLSDNSLICTHLYVSTESIHELPPNTDGSIVYESGKSSADFVNGAQYYAQIQTFTDIGGTEGGSGLSVAKMFWCLDDPTLTIDTIPSTISTTSYNVSATYNANTSVVSNIIQQYQFSLYSATGSLLQSSGVVVGNGEQQGTSTAYDISYNFTGLSVGSSYYVVVDVTTTQGMSVSTQSSTFTVSIDTPTLGEATVVNNACDGYISVTSNLSSEYGGSGSGETVSFETDSENVFSKLQVTFSPTQSGSGTPSPSNVRPIYGVGGVEVDVVGKNLFDKDNAEVLVAYFSSNTIVAGTGRGIVYIPCFPNTQYVVSRNRVETNDRFAVAYTTVKPVIGCNQYGAVFAPYNGNIGDNLSITITTGADAKYLAVWAYWDNTVNALDTLQIELGSTATAYEPYQEQTVSQEFDVSLTPTSTDTDPYLFKAVGDVYGDRLEEELVGVSVIWNQLIAVPSSSISKTENGVTITDNRDGTYSVIASGGATAVTYATLPSVQVIKDHVYLWSGTPKGGGQSSYDSYMTSNVTYANEPYDYGGGILYKASASGTSYIVPCRVKQGTTISNAVKFIPQLTDLTQHFGNATVADAIYNMEQAETGSGIALLKASGFFNKYMPYDTGTLKSVNPTAHVTRGVNAWDEEWEVGGLNASGQPVNNDTQIRSKNYIPVLQGKTYYVKSPYQAGIGIYEYDADKNFIDSNFVVNATRTLTARTRFVKFRSSNGVTTYDGGICINISDPTINGKYFQYEEHIYDLGNVPLYGLFQLVDNKLRAYGDVRHAQGGTDRKFALVDLGTLNYTKIIDGNFYSAQIADIKNISYNDVPNAIVGNGYQYSASAYGSASNNKTYCIHDKRIWLVDTAYTDAAAFKTAMAGVYLVYEKETTTTEQTDPFTQIQEVSKYGTLEYITSNNVPVGHNTTYYTRDIFGGYIDLVSSRLVVDRISKIPNIGVFSAESSGYSNINYLQVYKQADSVNINNTTVNGLLTSMFTPEVGSNWDSTDNIGKFLTGATYTQYWIGFPKSTTLEQAQATVAGLQICYKLATPLTYQLTPQQIQTLVGTNNVWSEQGDIELSYHIPITNLLVKRQDVDDVSGNWLTLYSQPITQASDMDFTFIDFLNQYGKTYKYALVPLLTQTQSGVEVEVEGGYTVSDEVQSIFDGVFISDSTGSQKCKANVGYGNVNMNQSVGSITPIGSQYPIIVTNSNNRYHNGSISGMIVPDDYYYNGNLSRIDMVNKRNELEQFLTNKRAKIIKDWNSNIWLVMIMDNIDCSFDNNYGMGIVTFNANWLEVGDPTNQEDLQATGLVDVGGV